MSNKKINHNYNHGFINYCQICNTQNIDLVCDFGWQPLADDLIQSKIVESVTYPIKIYLCKNCRILQNNYIIPDKKLYSPKYHYRPGISKAVAENLNTFARKLIKQYNLKKNDLIIDIGCNDGTLLKVFKNYGFTNLVGIDPTDTIKFCKNQKYIKTYQNFFNFELSKLILEKHGHAKLITTTNVFAHMSQLGSFIKGVKRLMNNQSIFVLENHYLLDIVKKLQFDSFYHEHLRTYSLKSLIKLFGYYKLEVIDAYRTKRYNGNIQVHIAKSNFKKSLNVSKLLINENKFDLDKLDTYNSFMKKIEKSKNNLLRYLEKNKDKKIVGKSYPARASILLNYFDLKDKLNYIAEQPTSLKIGHKISGTNIEIVNSNRLLKDKPDIIIIFAWHLFSEIKNKWIEKGLSKKTKYILMLPKFKVF